LPKHLFHQTGLEQLNETAIILISAAVFQLKYKYKKQFSADKYYFVPHQMNWIYDISEFFLISDNNYTMR